MRARTGSNALVLAGLAAALAASPAAAASFDFAPAPQTDLNRVYRVDRLTGEVTSCQYGLQEGTVGATLCFGSGDGAGPQVPGEYALVPSRHVREAGIFRVNGRTGEMSICYVLEDNVVCTPQGGPPPPAARPASGSVPAQRPQ